MLEFKKVGYGEISTIKPVLLKADNRACEFSMGNSILWDVDQEMEYTILEDHLIYRMVEEQEVRYCLPYFDGNVNHILEELRQNARELERPAILTHLSEAMVQQLREQGMQDLEFEFDRDSSDYIYEVQDLVWLRGKRFHKKKNHVNSFRKNYEFTYEHITPQNVEECRSMKNQWMAERETSESLQVESHIIDEAIDHYEELGFTGGLIRVDNRVMAFTMGEQLTEDTFVTHFEKALDEVNDLYPMINQQFAEQELQQYTYVNREEDLGIEGLRKAKLSYRPVMMADKYYTRL